MLKRIINFLAEIFDDEFPISTGNLSSSASLLARHGAELRRESQLQKRLRVHTELEAYVSAKRAGVAQ